MFSKVDCVISSPCLNERVILSIQIIKVLVIYSYYTNHKKVGVGSGGCPVTIYFPRMQSLLDVNDELFRLNVPLEFSNPFDWGNTRLLTTDSKV